MKLNLWITLRKGLLAALTFGVAFITPQFVLSFVPDRIESLTIGAAITAVVVAIGNVVKTLNK